jgi:hypothetical protein
VVVVVVVVVVCALPASLTVPSSLIYQGGFARYDLLHALLPELLKRLDDNDNDVRCVLPAMATLLKDFFSCVTMSPFFC